MKIQLDDTEVNNPRHLRNLCNPRFRILLRHITTVVKLMPSKINLTFQIIYVIIHYVNV